LGVKMLSSRDHRHLIDGSLPLNGFRGGWMAEMTALGQTRTSPARSIGSGGQRSEERLCFRDLGKFRGRRKALERGREQARASPGRLVELAAPKFSARSWRANTPPLLSPNSRER
jgi:hypothetical protein